MPTLSTILHEKKDDIINLMAEFNFDATSVQVLCHFQPEKLVSNSDADEFPHTLYFVAKENERMETHDEENEESHTDYLSLEVHLSEKLNCDIGVLILKDLQGMYWQPLFNYMAPITDENKIANLFNVTSLDNVQIDELKKEDKHFQHRQKLARRLPEKKEENLPSVKVSPSSPHSIFKRKRSDSDEFGYSPTASPASTTDSESDRDDSLVNQTVEGFKGLPIETIDKLITKLQKLKQEKIITPSVETGYHPKKLI